MDKQDTKEIKEKIEQIKKDKPKDAKKDKQETREQENIKTLDKQLEEKEKKIAELTDLSQRMQAEMQNFKKRCEKENDDFKKYMHAEFIGKILPILDSFELALKNSENNEKFVKGVELIYSQLYDMMQKEGLRPIKTTGEKFDPYKHEVLLCDKTEKDEEDEKICEELQKGYMFKDKVLRFSKVKILKK